DGSVGLARVDLRAGVLFVVIVEHLRFAHADIGGISLAGITNGEAVVAAGGHFEFHTGDEVGELGVPIRGAAFLGLPLHGAVFDFDDVGGVTTALVHGPAGEVFAVEDRFEALLAVAFENLAGFVAADFADEQIAPADFAAVGLEFDRTAREDRQALIGRLLF